MFDIRRLLGFHLSPRHARLAPVPQEREGKGDGWGPGWASTGLSNLVMLRLRMRHLTISICNRTTRCQLGNNWMKKKSEGSQIGRGRTPSPIWPSEEFFHPIISKLDKHVVPLLTDYTVQIS